MKNRVREYLVRSESAVVRGLGAVIADQMRRRGEIALQRFLAGHDVFIREWTHVTFGVVTRRLDLFVGEEWATRLPLN